MKIKIRKGREEDFRSVRELSKELGYTLPEISVAKTNFLILLNSDNDEIWIAESKGAVVGWIHAFISYKFASASFMEIAGLVVSPGFRRRGIGKMLVSQVLNRSQLSGLKIRVRCNHTRTETHRFYHNIGFTQLKSQYVFEQQLFSNKKK